MAHANAALKIAPEPPARERDTLVETEPVVGAIPSASPSVRRLPPPFPNGSEDPEGFARSLTQAIETGNYKLARRMLAESAAAIKNAGGSLDRLRTEVDLLGARTEHLDDRLTRQRADLKALTGRVTDQEKLNQQILTSGQQLYGRVTGVENDVAALRAEFAAFREEASKCAWGQHEAIARLINCETIRGWGEEEKAANRKTIRYIAVNGACATAIGVVVLAIIHQMGWLPAISRLFN